MSNVNLAQLFQVYYNWLYSPNGSLYILDNHFEKLKDVDDCPPELTSGLLSNYLPDSRYLIDGMNVVSLIITASNIRNFLNKVQSRFCDTKGTAGSIQYFCNTLLGASNTEVNYNSSNVADVILYFRDIPRINIEFLEDYISLHIIPVGIDVTVSIASTNERMSSAELRSGDDSGRSELERPNKRIPEFNNWEILNFGEGAYDGTGTGEEISIIGNYFPYGLLSTTSIASTAGCSGSTLHNGISGGATGNRNNLTTYAFPDWSTAVKIAGSSFGLLNINDFAFLSAASGNTSPNDGREISGFCPIGGYA